MKALLVLAVAVSLTFGQLTQYSEDYKPILDTITSIYTKQQIEYYKVNKGSTYQWKLMDISQYPSWCSDTSLNRSGLAVTVDNKGTVGLWSRKKDVDYVQIVAMDWTTNVEKRNFSMFFFKKFNNKWIGDRSPAKITVRINKTDQFYYYCE